MERLIEADEAFLTSSTRDVQPISAVDGRALPSCPGPPDANRRAPRSTRSRPRTSTPESGGRRTCTTSPATTSRAQSAVVDDEVTRGRDVDGLTGERTVMQFDPHDAHRSSRTAAGIDRPAALARPRRPARRSTRRVGARRPTAGPRGRRRGPTTWLSATAIPSRSAGRSGGQFTLMPDSDHHGAQLAVVDDRLGEDAGELALHRARPVDHHEIVRPLEPGLGRRRSRHGLDRGDTPPQSTPGGHRPGPGRDAGGSTSAASCRAAPARCDRVGPGRPSDGRRPARCPRARPSRAKREQVVVGRLGLGHPTKVGKSRSFECRSGTRPLHPCNHTAC